MPVVTELPTGGYAMVYEVVGPEHVGGVYLETSPDGTEWGDPTDVGQPVRTAESHQLTNGPYVTWTPAGGDDGTLLVAAKTLRDRDGEQAPGSGSTLLATTDLSGEEPWTPLSAPLSYEDSIDVDHPSVAWTTQLLPSPDGSEILQLTSTYCGEGRCEIRYAARELAWDEL
jgi:hypothetical protein